MLTFRVAAKFANSPYFGHRTPLRPPMNLKPFFGRPVMGETEKEIESVAVVVKNEVRQQTAVPPIQSFQKPAVTIVPQSDIIIRRSVRVVPPLKPRNNLVNTVLSFQSSSKMGNSLYYKITASAKEADERDVEWYNRKYFQRVSHHCGSFRNFGRKPRRNWDRQQKIVYLPIHPFEPDWHQSPVDATLDDMCDFLGVTPEQLMNDDVN